jgi:hypothetical protein
MWDESYIDDKKRLFLRIFEGLSGKNEKHRHRCGECIDDSRKEQIISHSNITITENMKDRK